MTNRRKGPWLAGFTILVALSVASAGASAYVFLTADDARAAGAAPKTGGTATPAAGGTPARGWGSPIDKAKAKPARTPQRQPAGDTSEERIAANTHKVGDAVMFTNQAAIRVDAVEPATIWPGSQAEKTLRKWRKKIRIFAVRYTYTNFTGSPADVRGLSSLSFKTEPFAADLKWPIGTRFPEVTYSNAAVLPSGIAAGYWPRLEPPERSEATGGHIVGPGQSIKGVFVTLDVRPRGSKIRLEVGNYRKEGHAWYLLTTP